ncbi:DegT/DnrJ/EryC1/StrS aminotransferase family protein [Micromonospora sp. HUAS LYJ1]|uniref:DegT/DnrJ/EryC1/StrS family aminotransferase n=1 Tax=Micromonospora sp. HUAS LYJ1 TaxID=3061626 RepID=UPI0026716BFF|nr:DegT/DnrJ/EryC1/StrS family aminotransferase [Micromonospora sp. HUAS LYJ1]WKU07206.1 DegT/DnrJ/EryC1/StrS family aminotransferase [Micromonospora sp. HUAS LYJ1]
MSAPPARHWRITLADNTVDEHEIAAVTEVLRSRWLSAGAQTAAFEREFADRIGTDDAVAVSSGTAALHLAMMALDLRPGDEVIMPALTFVAGAAVVALAGAIPVLADVRAPDDLTVDPVDVARLVTGQTRAVVAMHYAGYPADLAALRAVTDRHGAVLIEDAAHAPMVEHDGRMLGTHGDIGCFSFFATKNVTAGEGGMVVARDDAVRHRIRLARSHHLTTSTWDRLRSGDASYDVAGFGLNYRPTEVAAALGRVQLGKLPLDRERRRSLVATYREVLAAAPELVLPFAGRTGDSALHLMPVVLPTGTDRGAVREGLAAAGVQTSVHYPPVHHLSAYRSSPGAGRSALTVTNAVAARLLSLPLHSRMSDDDAALAAAALLRCLRQR